MPPLLLPCQVALLPALGQPKCAQWPRFPATASTPKYTPSHGIFLFVAPFTTATLLVFPSPFLFFCYNLICLIICGTHNHIPYYVSHIANNQITYLYSL